jgi:large subunit ribosomal protein L6
MSRIGKLPVSYPKGVDVSVNGNVVSIKGPKAAAPLTLTHHPLVSVKVEKDKNQVVVSRVDDSRQARAQHGTVRALINNMVKGAVEGYEKKLEIHGVGYDGELKGKSLVLKVGYANQITLPVPDALKVTAVAQSVQGNRVVYISVSGPDKQLVGQFAAAVRAVRPPEPYKQKGIRYADEAVRKKAGKAFAGGGAG